MKRSAVILGLVVVLGGGAIVGWNQWSSSQEAKSVSGEGYAMVTSAELVPLVNQKKDMQIIDLREPFLYAKGHIPGAINIPFQDFEKRINEVSSNKPVVFVCHTGPMGDVASQMLVQRGGQNVSNLKGGMAAWNGPLTTN
ncbi:rhodanese-like domain-containing protein [Effusibacillus dendaii]|uniref:Rhodanese domain-containing protein n=1 Tax=Effusibacillus dendaii TaxID=2743772 RepID=A0A7I8DG86_9BACL|nr:rhodanese-like domain-containing protein [Effusibacillus dendaii]BCJ88342.1 hypothetical protein skT53_33270 [Effusibacillus dendaii]